MGHCGHCECPLYEDDSSSYVDDVGDVCEDCLERSYIYLDGCGYVHQDDAYYDDIDHEYIHRCDAAHLEDGRTTHEDNATYCGNGVYHASEDCVELQCGDYAHKDDASADYNGEYYFNDDLVCMDWGLYEGEMAYTEEDGLVHTADGYGIEG
jgi:hypothetical protein